MNTYNTLKAIWASKQGSEERLMISKILGQVDTSMGNKGR